MLRQSQSGEQLSAVSSSHSQAGDGGAEIELPDLEKLSLDKGRPLDVDDLDEAGWKAASKGGKIKELGSLGEGAGGAVTRCVLEGAKTVFALKVSPGQKSLRIKLLSDNRDQDHYHRSEPRCEATDCARTRVQ